MKRIVLNLIIMVCFVIPMFSQIIADFKVNDMQGSSDQFYPSISLDGKGNFVIAWSDGRNEDRGIFAQRFSSEGAAIGPNFKVNDGEVLGNWGWPRIASDSIGNFVITWGDERNFEGDVFAQRYSSEGLALGDNFRVNDDNSDKRQYDPEIATDYNGNFVITWYDTRNGGYDVYAQRYLSNGTALGDNFKVNDGDPRGFHDGPSISTDGTGNFVITWTESRKYDFDIYAQRYSSDGAALSGNFKVNSLEFGDQDNPSISSDSNGNFIITWLTPAGANDGYDVYAQRYLSDGTALGDNFKANDGDQGLELWGPSVSTDSNGNFMIYWNDGLFRDTSTIFAQRYSNNGSRIGNNFRITTTGTSIDAALWNERIYSTWNDFDRSNDIPGFDDITSYDIWANVLSWDNPYGISEMQILAAYPIIRIFPNPTYNLLTIETENPNLCSIEITSLNGRLLLSDDVVGPIHQLDLSSFQKGVYFITIRSKDFVTTEKIIKL